MCSWDPLVLVRALRGNSEANLSHSDAVDGTEEIRSYKYDHDLELIDTPGLDSGNFSSHVVEQVQKMKIKVMIVLVTSKRSTRFNCGPEFEEILRDLIGTDAKFSTIQTFSHLNLKEYNEYPKKFPSAKVYMDSDLDSFKISFSDEELFHIPKANAAALKAAKKATKKAATKAAVETKVRLPSLVS